MATTKITRKGQVTIPVEIREKLNLHEGDILTVREEDHKVVFESARAAFLNALEAIRANAKAGKSLTADEMDEVVAGAIVEDYRNR